MQTRKKLKFIISPIGGLEKTVVEEFNKNKFFENDSNTIVGLIKYIKSKFHFKFLKINSERIIDEKRVNLNKRKFDIAFKSLSKKNQFEFNNAITLIDKNITEIIEEEYSDEYFIDNFAKKLFKITPKHLEYINKCLTNLKKNEVTIEKIDLKTLCKIQKKAFILNQLKEKNITSKNYSTKVKAYDLYRLKGLDEFGIKLPINVPFSNPTKLYEEIDILLQKRNLTDDERQYFYNILSIRERMPKQTNIKSKILKSKLFYLALDVKEQLSPNEQEAIFKGDKNYKFSDSYFTLLHKYKLKKIPKEFSSYEYRFIEYTELNEEYKNTQFLEKLEWTFDIEGYKYLEMLLLKEQNYNHQIYDALKKTNLITIIKFIENYKLYPLLDIEVTFD